MRWDGLFADLEAQAEALAIAERSAEIEDRTRSEVARLSLCDRLRPAVGNTVRLTCAGSLALAGRLQRVHPEWLLIYEDTGREALVRLDAVLGVSGLPRLSAAADTLSLVDARIGLTLVLRRIARDRANVQLHLADASVLAGTVDRVGADFLELAVHPSGEPRRRSLVLEMAVVPVSGLVAVRRNA